MDPTGSPFRRPPPRPAFRVRPAGFGPVPAPPLVGSRRSAVAARGRRRGAPRESRGRALRLGAGAIYLVAALTLLDAALSLAAYGRDEIIGLGLTRWAAGIAPEGGASLALAAGFTLLGLLAQRGRLWAFAVGVAVYALDGLIVLAVPDWVGVAIHTVVLAMMVRGLDAGRRLS